jgi:hypothetical protein
MALETLPERMVGYESLELRDQRCVASECEVGLDPELVRCEAELLQARDSKLRKAFVAEVGESRAAPEGESLTEQGGAADGISFLQGVLAVLGESLEAVEVELVGSDPEEVPGGTGEEHVAWQRLSKLGDTNA